MRVSKIYGLSLVAILTATTLLAPVARAQLDQVSSDVLFDLYGSDAPTDEFDFPALLYFNNRMDNDAVINSYLLSYFSDRIYSDDFYYSDEWVDEFIADAEEMGGFNVQFKSHPVSGAEVATIETLTSLIVVFRGSSYNGTTATNILTDWFHDFDDDARLRWIGKNQVYVHEGFWNSAESVFDFVKPIVQDAQARGKDIWLTGHSLGGATAMLTAARLHYGLDIEVRGVETFGAPRVGGEGFVKLMQNADNDVGVDLASRTLRWVVDGDSAVSLFGGDWVIEVVRTRRGTKRQLVWVDYHHVGFINHVYRNQTPEGAVFTVDEDAPDLSNSWPFSLGSLNDEHLDYVRPLQSELSRLLSQAGDHELLEKLLKTP